MNHPSPYTPILLEALLQKAVMHHTPSVPCVVVCCIAVHPVLLDIAMHTLHSFGGPSYGPWDAPAATLQGHT